MKTLNQMTSKIKSAVAVVFISSSVSAQSPSKLAVMDIEADGIMLNSNRITELVRIEVDKTGQAIALDRHELKERTDKPEGCYSTTCAVVTGKKAGVEKVIAGSVLKFGERIVISLRLIDVAQGSVVKSSVMEYLDIQKEIQKMIEISVRDLYDLKNDPKEVNLLIRYNQPIESPKTRLKLNGPRVGIAYVTGKTGEILQASKADGGFEMYPVMSQIGYQFEVQYLSAGDFQALFEFLPMLTGLDQNFVNPSITIMNGFRLNDSGWEIAFGPSVKAVTMTNGFYDTAGMFGKAGQWHRSSEWYNLCEANGYLNEDKTAPKNHYTTMDRLDSRGDLQLTSSWVWAVGKTFKSGYLNIPVNAYCTPRKEGWLVGASVGFNLAKR